MSSNTVHTTDQISKRHRICKGLGVFTAKELCKLVTMALLSSLLAITMQVISIRTPYLRSIYGYYVEDQRMHVSSLSIKGNASADDIDVNGLKVGHTKMDGKKFKQMKRLIVDEVDATYNCTECVESFSPWECQEYACVRVGSKFDCRIVSSAKHTLCLEGRGECSSDFDAVCRLRGVSSISAYVTNACVGLYDGTAMCWGPQNMGATGSGSTSVTAYYPVNVVDASGDKLQNVKSVIAGHSCTFFLMTDNTIMSTGFNQFGKLGLNSMVGSFSVPVLITGLTGVLKVATAKYYTTALLSTGEIATWGYNRYASMFLGTNDVALEKELSPVLVHGLNDIGFINNAIDVSSNIALLANGVIVHWGVLDFIGGSGYASINANITSYAIASVYSQVDTRPMFYAVTLDGNLLAWGNGYFADGSDTLKTQLNPTIVIGFSDKIANVVPHEEGATVLQKNGCVYQWWPNKNYGFGNAKPQWSYARSVHGFGSSEVLCNVTMVSSAMAIHNRQVLRWGQSSIGDGSTVSRKIPVYVLLDTYRA